jgi:hypothetical protein
MDQETYVVKPEEVPIFEEIKEKLWELCKAQEELDNGNSCYTWLDPRGNPLMTYIFTLLKEDGGKLATYSLMFPRMSNAFKYQVKKLLTEIEKKYPDNRFAVSQIKNMEGGAITLFELKEQIWRVGMTEASPINEAQRKTLDDLIRLQKEATKDWDF